MMTMLDSLHSSSEDIRVEILSVFYLFKFYNHSNLLFVTRTETVKNHFTPAALTSHFKIIKGTFEYVKNHNLLR